MIPVNTPIWQSEAHWQQQDWQTQLSGMIRDPEQLFQRLNLNPADQPEFSAALKQFPLRVTEAFVAKMQPGNWQDPLLLQILPRWEEQLEQTGYSSDPLQEVHSNPTPGLIHKYQGRVLLIVGSACAVNCRYCFRRSFPYEDNKPSQSQWQQALDYIAARPEIHEVILSGGDPLAVSNSYLAKLLARIADIPHVETLRIHTRLPLVLPARVDDQLIETLTQCRLKAVMVIHCNHPNELDQTSLIALKKLKRAEIELLNQSVLLHSINDNVTVLKALSQRLFQSGVLPYYLHLLDRVTGASHFDVEEATALKLIADLRLSLPGYLVPRLVREKAGEGSKTPIGL